MKCREILGQRLISFHNRLFQRRVGNLMFLKLDWLDLLLFVFSMTGSSQSSSRCFCACFFYLDILDPSKLCPPIGAEAWAGSSWSSRSRSEIAVYVSAVWEWCGRYGF